LEQELIHVEDSDDEVDEHKNDINETMQSTGNYNIATADTMHWHGDSLQTTAI